MASKLTLQKRLAAKILKTSRSKIWIDPTRLKDAQVAITHADVRRLVSHGVIKKIPDKISRPKERRKRRRGPGSRKGSKYAKVGKKRRWINTVRPLRRMLRELKAEGSIDNRTYRRLYMLVKGGQFRNRSHMRIYLQQHGILKEKQKEEKK